jgi:hypothetical protein
LPWQGSLELQVERAEFSQQYLTVLRAGRLCVAGLFNAAPCRENLTDAPV